MNNSKEEKECCDKCKTDWNKKVCPCPCHTPTEPREEFCSMHWCETNQNALEKILASTEQRVRAETIRELDKKMNLLCEEKVREAEQRVREEVVSELESNPNPDGSISPNIQHWIEAKQKQLLKSLTKEKI